MAISYNRRHLVSIFLISFAIIAQQLLLIRTLSITHYYHFSYLVISTALLGFGASGTFLALFFDRLKRNFSTWVQIFCFLFLISVPFTFWLSNQIPLDTQYLLYSFEQVSLLYAYHFLQFLPFFFGGTVIGMLLTFYKKQVSGLYGADLLGSGTGGTIALAIIAVVPAETLSVAITPVIFLALVMLMLSDLTITLQYRIRSLLLLFLGLIITTGSLMTEKELTVDPYKDLANFRQLEQQGDAEEIARRSGPKGMLHLFESKTFHHTLFAGLQATDAPPDQLALLVDGFTSTPVFKIEREEEAGIMDFTPQSLPYRITELPSVLLVGETGGANIWLAKRFGAGHITVLQENEMITGMIRDEIKGKAGEVFTDNNVEVIHQHPRVFFKQSGRKFEIIQLVSEETLSTGTSGLLGLNENYLMTREGIKEMISLLSPDGLISITRGLQSPPRDNLKILHLFADALRASGAEDPFQHLLISRNYLAVNSILSNSKADSLLISSFIRETESLDMDTEFYPGIESEEQVWLNIIEGPEDKNYSWLHEAVLSNLEGKRDTFQSGWIYNIETPTDNKPYFYDFFKWSSIDKFYRDYGENWFRQLELGYIVLLITCAQLTLAAFILIIMPLLARFRRYAESKNKLPALLHFLGIGTGFMFLEIIFIQQFTLFLGEPVYSASAVLSSILVFSGLGSIMQKRYFSNLKTKIRFAVLAILFITTVLFFITEFITNSLIHLPAAARYLITILLLMPLSFFMGWMFPAGIEQLDIQSGELIPWAWGINGFASVAASPLAILLSMSFGLTAVIALAMVFYLFAALSTYLWKK